MKPGWVAGSVRARLLATRCLGGPGAREIAAAGSLRDALSRVAASPYGRDVDDEMTLVDAERGVRSTALWHLRVLAGWLPPGGSDIVRVVAAGYEIANVEAHVDALAGGPDEVPFALGALATIQQRGLAARSVEDLRAVLSSSQWGDPGTGERGAIGAALRLAWARRIFHRIPELRRAAAAAAAVVVASERFGVGRELSAPAAVDARRLLGAGWTASDFASFVQRVPADARWVFSDVDAERSLWRAEITWWRRLQVEAARSVGRASIGEAVVAWSAALLLADAQRVCAALEAAAWGPVGLEVFDAVA